MNVDVLVVGAGPAGLAAAIELRRLGAGQVLVAEREQQAGGIPRHCAHTGYGLRDLHRVMTGPGYARHYAEAAARAGAQIRTETTVTGLTSGRLVTLTSPAGIETVSAAAVLLATGCRERPRSARLVPGDRPPGIMTTGELQQRVHLAGQRLPGRALIVGAEHVSFSAIVTLAHAGAEVVALVTEQPRHQSYAAFALGASLRWRVPVWTSTMISGVVAQANPMDVTLIGTQPRESHIHRVRGARPAGSEPGPGPLAGSEPGPGRLAGVEVTDLCTGAVRFVRCDTLVFSGDWIPDHELARLAGVAIDHGTRGPAVDMGLETSVSGIFAAGNLVHAAEMADVAALGGRHAARQIAAVLRDQAQRGAPEEPVPITVAPPLAWISPSVIRGRTEFPPRGRFLLRSEVFARRARLEVRQQDIVLARARARLVPSRPVRLDAGWLGRVEPGAGPVQVLLR